MRNVEVASLSWSQMWSAWYVRLARPCRLRTLERVHAQLHALGSTVYKWYADELVANVTSSLSPLHGLVVEGPCSIINHLNVLDILVTTVLLLSEWLSNYNVAINVCFWYIVYLTVDRRQWRWWWRCDCCSCWQCGWAWLSNIKSLSAPDKICRPHDTCQLAFRQQRLPNSCWNVG